MLLNALHIGYIVNTLWYILFTCKHKQWITFMIYLLTPEIVRNTLNAIFTMCLQHNDVYIVNPPMLFLYLHLPVVMNALIRCMNGADDDDAATTTMGMICGTSTGVFQVHYKVYKY